MHCRSEYVWIRPASRKRIGNKRGQGRSRVDDEELVRQRASGKMTQHYVQQPRGYCNDCAEKRCPSYWAVEPQVQLHLRLMTTNRLWPQSNSYGGLGPPVLSQKGDRGRS